jgi:hypothetical protein
MEKINPIKIDIRSLIIPNPDSIPNKNDDRKIIYKIDYSNNGKTKIHIK